VELVHVEQMGDRSAALKREAAIKRLSRPAKLALIHNGPEGHENRQQKKGA
jgi:predicted GIY-YIG superfamily endonuclease